jgi:hypothetical protein
MLLISLLMACGSKNLVEDRVDKTPDEEIRVAIDAENYERARVLLEEQIELHPEEYKRHVILSAVYAVLAGFDLLGAIKNDSQSDNAIDQVSVFLTEDTTDENLELMTEAVQILQLIPEDQRSLDAEESYGLSAMLQLTLYQAAYAVMILNQFISIDPSTSEIDLDRLREMSDEEAEAVLRSLIAAAESSPEGAAISGSLSTTLDAIDNSEGETTRERLIDYVSSR